MASDRLIVFTRYPEPGRTKTRLIGTLGATGAAELQRRMTLHTLTTARDLAAAGRVEVEVRFHGGDEAAMRRSFGDGVSYREQGEGDLGDRLARSVDDARREGAASVIVIGSDCPGIDVDVLGRAFDLVRDDPLRIVLGPASDGGYYLIGLGHAAPEVFADIAWGTEIVLDQTLEAARRAGRPTRLLDVLADVDRPEDGEGWYSARRSAAGRPGAGITVIIPALDEEESIGRALDSAMAPGAPEVIVVDGGSRDRTVEIAAARGATVLASPTGRARQMNAGAARAGGDILLFLHADTTLPGDYARLVREALDRPGVVAGAFDLGIEGEGRRFRWIERLVGWRSRKRQMPYGDQALFMPAEVFRELGGYPEIPIMEDVELVRRLRSHGRIHISPARVRTSARRWLKHGILTAMLNNQLCLLAHGIGIPAARIAGWRRPHGADRTKPRQRANRGHPDSEHGGRESGP
jgi:rSAM/selenodomain-associated transferase 2/rSAM/selenodomain-associated transferase 1